MRDEPLILFLKFKNVYLCLFKISLYLLFTRIKLFCICVWVVLFSFLCLFCYPAQRLFSELMSFSVSKTLLFFSSKACPCCLSTLSVSGMPVLCAAEHLTLFYGAWGFVPLSFLKIGTSVFFSKVWDLRFESRPAFRQLLRLTSNFLNQKRTHSTSDTLGSWGILPDLQFLLWSLYNSHVLWSPEWLQEFSVCFLFLSCCLVHCLLRDRVRNDCAHLLSMNFWDCSPSC